MRIPTIYELYKLLSDKLIEKEKRLEELKKDPLNNYIVSSLEGEIRSDKKILNEFITDNKYKIREEKLKQLGL
jgi:hypothetical protein